MRHNTKPGVWSFSLRAVRAEMRADRRRDLSTPFRLHGRSRARYLFRMKNTVATGSQNLVASQKARDGGDPLETGMTEGGSEPVGADAFLVTFSCAQKVTRRRNRGPKVQP
jgi:hypothetical protein